MLPQRRAPRSAQNSLTGATRTRITLLTATQAVAQRTYISPGTEQLVRELIEKHRFNVEHVRGVEERFVGGEWHFPCKTGAITYQHDEHT